MLEQPRGKELSFAGNFNVELENMGGRGQDEEIVAEVETSGLEDLEGHFLPQQRAWCKDWRTWEAGPAPEVTIVIPQGGSVQAP